MKHFANYIDIYPASLVNSIVGSTITTSDGSVPDRIYSFTKIELMETQQIQTGNSYYSQNTRVVASEKLASTLRTKYSNNRPVIVKLYDDQGNTIVWGSTTERARILITPNLEKDVLNISRKSINAVL